MTGRLVSAMIAHDRGDARRINHFLKVWAYAKSIGECEGLPEETQRILEAAALLHDVGIRVCEQKYGSCTGPQQELEGPPIACAILESLGYTPAFAERVCYLVGHHHTYSAIDGDDYQILVEADFLVNLHEGGEDASAARAVREKLFKTQTGKAYLDALFLEKAEEIRIS